MLRSHPDVEGMPVGTATSVALPDFLPYLLAIFGLLVLWQYYQLHVMKGRILAIDIFDRSGIRMYLYAVTDDSHACEVCRSAHGTVFPPSEVMKSTFSPIKGTCKSSISCIGFLVGLYGAWPEAQLIVERLRLSRKREPIQLDQDELREVILGPWERSISANTDRLGISVLEAVLGDCANPNPAIDKYRHMLITLTPVSSFATLQKWGDRVIPRTCGSSVSDSRPPKPVVNTWFNAGGPMASCARHARVRRRG